MRVTIFLCLIGFAIGQDDPKMIRLDQQRKYLQGDLKMNPASLLDKTRNAILSQRRKWPNGVIPYEISPTDFSANERKLIQTSMRRIMQGTCIKFIPRQSHSDYVLIRSSNDGCYTTNVGYARGVTEISLESSRGPDCMHNVVIMHELLHAVGLWHEHMRYDRDQFVRINYQNVAPGLADQFNIVSASQSSTYNVPYDYTSIMHYGKTAFSVDGRSITTEPLQRQFLNVIGRSRDISSSDLLKVNRMYNCGNNADPTDGAPQPVPVPAPGQTNTCRDLTSACGSYTSYCRTWDVMTSYCRRTCNLC